MGLARRGQIGQAGHRHGAERRQPDVPRHEAADVLRRMGEHAYYIDYRNRRADAVAALWDRIDWKVVADRYEKNKGLFLLEMPPPVFGAAFSCATCKPSGHGLSAVAGAEYTGRGSLPSAGLVSGYYLNPAMGVFVLKNSSLCTFFRPWIPFSARKSVSSQHENSKVENAGEDSICFVHLAFCLGRKPGWRSGSVR